MVDWKRKYQIGKSNRQVKQSFERQSQWAEREQVTAQIKQLNVKAREQLTALQKAQDEKQKVQSQKIKETEEQIKKARKKSNMTLDFKARFMPQGYSPMLSLLKGRLRKQSKKLDKMKIDHMKELKTKLEKYRGSEKKAPRSLKAEVTRAANPEANKNDEEKSFSSVFNRKSVSRKSVDQGKDRGGFFGK